MAAAAEAAVEATAAGARSANRRRAHSGAILLDEIDTKFDGNEPVDQLQASEIMWQSYA